MQIVLAIEKEMGISLQEMASRKRGERLRMVCGIFTSLAREIGYNMMELQGILKRDVSVLFFTGNRGFRLKPALKRF